MKCASSGVYSWAWLSRVSCGLLLLSLVTLTAGAQALNSEQSNEPWSLSKASAELVERLTERKAELLTLRDNLQRLTDELTASQADSETLRQELADSRSKLVALQADLTETSRLLDASRGQLQDYRNAEELVKAALKRERDTWMWATVGTTALGVTAWILSNTAKR